MMIYLSTVVLSCFLLTVIVVSTVSAKAEESERLLEYKKRGYVWPITKFNPNTEGWSKLMQERLGQVEEIDDDAQRYKGYVTTLYPGLVINNLTEYGWGMTRISDDLLKDLQQAIRDGYDNRVGEGHTPIIEGDQAQWIERWDLMERAEEELHGVMEEWCGADLGLKMTYGLRLFQNKSSFRMHIDKKGSHAVGYVLHVDRSDDAQPWPFFIEDFHGRTHEILMTPGDVIMFECKQRYLSSFSHRSIVMKSSRACHISLSVQFLYVKYDSWQVDAWSSTYLVRKLVLERRRALPLKGRTMVVDGTSKRGRIRRSTSLGSTATGGEEVHSTRIPWWYEGTRMCRWMVSQ
jgi:hypothetical protein